MTDFKTQTFELRKSGNSRPTVLYNLINTIESLPSDINTIVKISQGTVSRNKIQNNFYQKAIGQAAKQTGNSVEYIAGWSKYHLLMSEKFITAAALDDDKLLDAAQFERGLCELLLAKYEGDTLYKAFDRAIRSKTLLMKPFSEYISRFLHHWGEQGVGFVLSRDDEQRALCVEKNAA